MAKFPEPPAALPPAQVVVLPAGTTLWRIYFAGGPHPSTWSDFRRWGPTGSRFDHQLPPPALSERGILYTATGGGAFDTCIAEVFQSARTIDRRARAPRIVAFRTTTDLHLLDLTSTWPTQAGASTAICSGPRPRARRWSQAIYGAFPTLHGIHYGSSMNASAPAQALYERAASAFPTVPDVDRALDDDALRTRVAAAATRLNYAFT